MTPTNTFPPYSATPRFTTSQQALAPTARSTFGSCTQRRVPVLASMAWTMLHADVTYITPSTTSGVASAPRFISRSYDQARPSLGTLAVSMAVSGL